MGEDTPFSRFVSLQECNNRHGKIELALFGSNGRGGMVKDVASIKASLGTCQKWIEEKKKEESEQEKGYRGFLYSLITGVVVGLIMYFLP